MLNSVEKTHVGSDKIDQYKWGVKDKKGSFQYISKNSLNVDHLHYQRDNITKAKVLSMAREWSWVACGAISVAKRLDATYWVMDGQYRTMAALHRSDIQDLPCMVFVVHDVKEEAKGFLDLNTNRKAMQYIDRFKAEITAGNQAAIFVKQLVESAGRRVSADGNSNSVRCVGALMQWVNRGNEAELRRIWPLLSLLCKDGAVSVNLVEGMMFLEINMQEGQSLSSKKISNRILDIGEKELIEATRSSAAFSGKGGAKIWADGIVVRYNKGLVHKLPVREGALTA
jgi:hypothetical protein